MSAILLSLTTFFSTLIGGLFGLRYRDHLYLIMGFTAGVLVGLVSFDLLPEIFRLVYTLHLDSTGPMLALMGGFLLFHIVEKSILIHFSHEEQYAVHQHPLVGILSAVALTGHSFLDGVGIGLGFQVSAAVGLVVAIAVISHDFSDGLNTVTLMLVNKNTSRRSFLLLLADAAAPVAGAISTRVWADVYEVPLGEVEVKTGGDALNYIARNTVTTAVRESITINGGHILQADVRADNGVIHVIDKVLIPPFTFL